MDDSERFALSHFTANELVELSRLASGEEYEPSDFCLFIQTVNRTKFKVIDAPADGVVPWCEAIGVRLLPGAPSVVVEIIRGIDWSNYSKATSGDQRHLYPSDILAEGRRGAVGVL